jgi:hypothetical protein
VGAEGVYGEETGRSDPVAARTGRCVYVCKRVSARSMSWLAGRRTAGSTRGKVRNGEPCLRLANDRDHRLQSINHTYRNLTAHGRRHSAAAPSNRAKRPFKLVSFRQAELRKPQSSTWQSQRTNGRRNRSRGRRAKSHSSRSTRRRLIPRLPRCLRAVYVLPRIHIQYGTRLLMNF